MYSPMIYPLPFGGAGQANLSVPAKNLPKVDVYHADLLGGLGAFLSGELIPVQ